MPTRRRGASRFKSLPLLGLTVISSVGSPRAERKFSHADRPKAQVGTYPSPNSLANTPPSLPAFGDAWTSHSGSNSSDPTEQVT